MLFTLMFNILFFLTNIIMFNIIYHLIYFNQNIIIIKIEL